MEEKWRPSKKRKGKERRREIVWKEGWEEQRYYEDANGLDQIEKLRPSIWFFADKLKIGSTNEMQTFATWPFWKCERKTVKTIYGVCSFVQNMTRMFPESEPFEFEGHSVYAGQLVDVDDDVEFNHSYTSDVNTISASINVTIAAGLILYHQILV